jgi:hypothetical protein
MTWEAWVGILLACVTLVLTALAIAIGIAAIWGYGEIKKAAGSQAQEAIDKKLNEYFGNLDIQARLKAEIEARVSREADQVYRDISITGGDVAETEQQGAAMVGEEYPTEKKK